MNRPLAFTCGCLALCTLLLFVGGGVFWWSLWPAAILALSGAFWSVGYAAAPGRAAWPRAARCLLLLGLAFFVVQCWPWPAALAGRWPGPRGEQTRAVNETMRLAARLDLTSASTASWHALTRNRAGTLRLGALFGLVTGGFVLARALSARARRRALWVLLLGGSVVAVTGFVGLRIFPQGDTLWWDWPLPHNLPGPVACFGNRNHFAGLLAVLSLLGAGMAVQALRRRCWVGGVAAGAGAGICAVVTLATHSRGAALAALAGGATLAWMVLRRLRARRARLAFAGLALAALAIVLPFAPAGLRERLASFRHPRTDDSFMARLNAWHDSIGIVRTYPTIGCGPNGFRMTYPQHRRTSRSAFLTHADNEYVQWWTDSGWVGLALAALALGLWWRACRSGGAVDDDDAVWISPALTVAAAHGAFDFAWHAPPYAFILALLLAWRIPSPASAVTTLPPEKAGRIGCKDRFTVGVWLAWLLITAGWMRTAETMDNRYRLAHLPVAAQLRALTWAPTFWQAWFDLGNHACARGTPEEIKFGEGCLARAAALDPMNYRAWLRLGEVRLVLGDTDGARAAFARVRDLRDWVPIPSIAPEAER